MCNVFTFGFLILLLSAGNLLAWEGRVFDAKGKDVTVYSADTSAIRQGAKLYIVRSGKLAGEGRAVKILHTQVHLRLTTGAAAKGDVVMTTKPVPPAPSPAMPAKIAAAEKPAKAARCEPGIAPSTPINWGILEAAERGDLAGVEAAVRAGTSVQSNDEYLRTPLSNAAKNGHVEVVKYLLRSNAVVDSKNKQCETPLMLASRYGHLEVVRVLLASGADPKAVDAGGYTPLKLAQLGEHPQVIETLKAALK